MWSIGSVGLGLLVLMLVTHWVVTFYAAYYLLLCWSSLLVFATYLWVCIPAFVPAMRWELLLCAGLGLMIGSIFSQNVLN